MFYFGQWVLPIARTKSVPLHHDMTKHKPVARRLTGMHAPMRQLAFSVVRVGAMVSLAMLLILGLLPAILSVQAATQ